MTTHRLHRRTALLRAKRDGAFDPGQYWHEGADRQRAMRKLRALLRLMQPVILSTPRWSQAHRFIEDLAVDLSVGQPAIQGHVLSLQAVQGKSALQAWAWVMARFTDLCSISVDRRFAQAVSRDGFRTLFANLLRQAQGGPRRCLMLYGLEAVHLDALRDLLDVYEQHMLEARDRRRINLLIAGTVDVPALGANVTRMTLPDYGKAEAIEALVEIVGPQPTARLERLIGAVGGVPAVIERLAAEGPAAIEDAVATREGVWRRLGPVGAEIRSAFAIVSADNALSQRLEQLAREGPSPEMPDRDPRLVRAGLVRFTRKGKAKLTGVRAPVFADLAIQQS